MYEEWPRMHDSRAGANVVGAYICVYKSSTVPPFPAGNMVKTSRLRQSWNQDRRSLQSLRVLNLQDHMLELFFKLELLDGGTQTNAFPQLDKYEQKKSMKKENC